MLGAEHWLKVWQSFELLLHVIRDVGIRESIEKRVELTQVINCLGNLVNAMDMTISVLPNRMQEIRTEVDSWSNKTTATK